MFSITRLCIVSLVSMLASSPLFGEADGAVRGSTNKCILQKVCAIDAKLQCDNAISFGSADINRPGGYIIRHPGYYCLKEDVVFDPAVSALTAPNPGAVQAAITIQASNVFLDLGPHRLSQAGAGTSTQVPYVVGILIPDAAPTNTDPNFVALQSIYIKGDDPAIIDGFSMYGIRIFGHTYDIRLTNITVKNCGQLASLALRPFPDYFPHTLATTPNYGSSMSVGGIVIGESAVFGLGPTFFTDTGNITQNQAKSVSLENISSLKNFFMGLFMANATDVYIGNSHFDDTYSDDPGNASGPNGPYAVVNAVGADFSGSNTMFEDPNILNMVVENSTFNSSSLNGDFTTPILASPMLVFSAFSAAGAALSKSRNITFSNCNFDNTSNTFAPAAAAANVSGAFTVGFVSGGIEDTTFIDCTFDGIQGLGSVNGFHVSGTSNAGEPIKSSRNTYLLNCTANNMQQIGNQQLPLPTILDGSVAGFAIAFAKDITLDSCIAQDINVNGALTPLSFVTGFAIDSTANQLPPLPDANVENVVMRNCIASRAIANNGGIVAGFLLLGTTLTSLNATKGVLFENCVASGNQTLPPIPGFGLVQGVACGFLDLQGPFQLSPDEFRSWPVTFINCKALHNKGVPVLSLAPPFEIFYSAGFYLFGAIRHSLFGCEADDNVYGVFLQLSTQCVVRDCRSDNNEDLLYATGTGEGFTDVGTPGTPGTKAGIPASPGVSTSLFEFNHAYNNGTGAIQVGHNGNYNVFVDPATATVSLPILEGKWSTSTYAFLNPPFYTPVHNISIIE